MQRIFVNPADAKRFVTLPNVTKYVRCHALVTLQCMLTPNCITDKEWEATFTQLLTKLEAAGPPGSLRIVNIRTNNLFFHPLLLLLQQ